MVFDYNLPGMTAIISTHPNLIRRARELGLLTIQRFFMLDSLSFANVLRQSSNADAVDVLPGAIPSVIRHLVKEVRQPLIASGLLLDKSDVVAALSAGAVAVSTTSFMASAVSYSAFLSIFLALSLYFLPLNILVPSLLAHQDTHGAGSAGDHAHSGLDGGGVEVGHLGLGDLLAVGLGQGGHLGLVGHIGAGLDIARLLDEHGGRGGLGDEGEGAVGVHGDDHGDDQAHVLLGALVELLGKGGDVHAVLAQSGANRGGGSRLAGGNL